MSRRSLGIAALAALVVLSSVAVASAWSARIQSLYAYVVGVNTDHEGSYNIKPAEAVPVQVGEEVDVSLWGTTGGEDEWVSASFSVAAGRDKIQIVGVTEDGVRVRIKGGSGGVAQLGYQVDGDYNMPGGLLEGRITFEIE